MGGYEVHDVTGMDGGHEMNDLKHRHQIVVEEEDKMVANAYPGQRTEQTKDTNTRVRVSTAIHLQTFLRLY